MTETEPLYVEVEPMREFDAPPLPRSFKRVTRVDLAEVERLAELGLKPAAIGPNLGLSVASFRSQWEKKRLIREAYEKGNAKWQKVLAERMRDYAADGGKEGVTATIFALKQSHGANWSDHVVTATEDKDNKAQQVFAERKKKVQQLPEIKLLDKAEVTNVPASGDAG